MTKDNRAWVLAYGAAALGVLLLIAVAAAVLRPEVARRFPALAFLLAVVFAAGCAGFAPSIVLRRELRRQMDRFAKAEERTRAVVNHVIDGIITITERGQVETFNPAAERIFGYQASEVIGRNLNMLMPEPDRGRHDSYLSNTNRRT
jgi:PAS domain-containing protein